MNEKTVSIEMRGIEAARAAVSATLRARVDAVRKAVKISGYELQGDIRRSILQDPHTGRVYGNHQASAPGETPASDTGNLARNIQVLSTPDGNGVIVTSRAPYSAALEFGAYHNRGGTAWFVAPRPFMGPGLARGRDKILARIRDAMRGTNE